MDPFNGFQEELHEGGYEVVVDPFTEEKVSVRRLSDGACIPFDHRNQDMAAFLEWNDSQPEGDRICLSGVTWEE